MTTRAKLTLCAGLATSLVALCLSPLLIGAGQWLPQAFLLIAVTAGAGAGLRRLPLPRVLVVPLQLLIVLYVLLLGFVQSSMAYGLLPGARVLDAVGSLLADGGTDIRQYAIPAPATAGLRIIVVGAVALIAVLVDALAVTYRRAAISGLPLLALYSVGTGLAGGTGGPAWLWFLLGAAGYLALLHTEGQDRLSRWGRVFHGTAHSSGGTATHGGYRVGVIALAAALLLPVFIPHAGLGLIDGFGKGTGDGSGPGGGLQSLNPVVALSANLRQGEYTELLKYSTDSPDESQMYLRVAALEDFNGVEWQFGAQALQPFSSVFPPPTGLSSDVHTAEVNTTVQISDRLSSEWLPLPYPAVGISVPGHWRLDPATMALTGDGGQRTNGLTYGVISSYVQPTAGQLRTASQAPRDIRAKYLKLPDNLPAVVRDTALQVTAGRTTGYDQAVALQNWFANGAFTYSTKVDAGTGPDAIAKFLQNKTGFCVHFAATMAAMARSLGIPARVAIGFTPGKAAGVPNTFAVGTTDYHAWPELYFQGSGWTRFEPTPGRGNVPGYTKEQPASAPSGASQQPTAVPSDTSTAAPSSSSSCDARQRKAGDCGGSTSAAAHTAGKQAWWLSLPALLSFGAAVLLLALLATPMVWRARLRRRRLGVGRHLPGAERAELTDAQVLDAWQELIDSAWDLGIPPDDARTPRRTVQRLAETAELDAESAAAAGRVALATEQVLYAREVRPLAPLGADVRAARDGLRARVGRLGRIRAVLLPASTVRVWWRFADRTMVLRQELRERSARVTDAVRGAVTRPFRRKS